MFEAYKPPTDWRGLCEELANELQGYASANPYHDSDALVARARIAPAQPEPEVEGPSDEELLDVASQAIEPYDQICVDEYEAENNCALEVYSSELIAFARAVLSRWGRPAPAPAGEVAELVALLRYEAREADLDLMTAEQCHRAADLLERQAALLRGGRQTLQQRLTNAMHHVTANRLDQRQVAQAPLPVSERPWERDGWCHPQERWAWFYNRRVGWRDAIPPESLKPPTLFPYTHSLPFNALPLPSGEVEHD